MRSAKKPAAINAISMRRTIGARRRLGPVTIGDPFDLWPAGHARMASKDAQQSATPGNPCARYSFGDAAPPGASIGHHSLDASAEGFISVLAVFRMGPER